MSGVFNTDLQNQKSHENVPQNYVNSRMRGEEVNFFGIGVNLWEIHILIRCVNVKTTFCFSSTSQNSVLFCQLYVQLFIFFLKIPLEHFISIKPKKNWIQSFLHIFFWMNEFPIFKNKAWFYMHSIYGLLALNI